MNYQVLGEIAGISMAPTYPGLDYAKLFNDDSKECVNKVFEELEGCDKELVDEYALSIGKPRVGDLNKILARWGQPKITSSPNDQPELPHVYQLLENMRTRLLFPHGTLLPEIADLAVERRLNASLSKQTEPQPNPRSKKICREDRIFELKLMFEHYLKRQWDYLSEKRIALQEMTYLGYDEVCFNNGLFCEPKDVEEFYSLKVFSALMMLTVGYAPDFPRYYQESNAAFVLIIFQIFSQELDCSISILPLDYYAFGQVNNVPHHLIFRELQSLAEGVSIDFDAFLENLKRAGYYSSNSKIILNHKGGWHEFYSTSNHICKPVTEAILSILCALGMVNLEWTERLYVGDLETIKSLEVTKLGRFILSEPADSFKMINRGQTPIDYEEFEARSSMWDYKELAPKGALYIAPDFTVTVQGAVLPIPGYNVFLKSLLSKNSSGDLVLDFDAFARFMELGMTTDKFLDVIRSSFAEVPKNVMAKLRKWIKLSRRPKIRTAYLLETDDAFLLAELKTLLGPMASNVDGIEIDPSETENLEKCALRAGNYVKFN
ncbi:MAG: hypothetical protein LBT59_26205 [Clostridiales bacterium]|nr:hypothetical protein [Clostridiales bacterium]